MPAKSVETLIRSTKIGEITNPKLVQAPPETSVKDGIALMQGSRAGYIVVAKNKKVVGIFTENGRDIVKVGELDEGTVDTLGFRGNFQTILEL